MAQHLKLHIKLTKSEQNLVNHPRKKMKIIIPKIHPKPCLQWCHAYNANSKT
jgi:hypothetical protein